MRVLLTNDDGIYAPGLWALYKELEKDYELEVVAPDSEMSAVGHAITLSSPLRVQNAQRNGTFSGMR
jgi:5'-nucleotidase